MKSSSKVILLAATSALALTTGSVSVNAVENPFAIKSLSSGYQVANHREEKVKDGKCGAEMIDKDMKKIDAKA